MNHENLILCMICFLLTDESDILVCVSLDVSLMHEWILLISLIFSGPHLTFSDLVVVISERVSFKSS